MKRSLRVAKGSMIQVCFGVKKNCLVVFRTFPLLFSVSLRSEANGRETTAKEAQLLVTFERTQEKKVRGETLERKRDLFFSARAPYHPLDSSLFRGWPLKSSRPERLELRVRFGR